MIIETPQEFLRNLEDNKMPDDLVTKITTQTFSEAGGVDAFPDLEIGGIVADQLDGTYDYFHAVLNLNEILDRMAKNKGYTHIFAVRYEWVKGVSRVASDDTVHRATGTGYKPRQ